MGEGNTALTGDRALAVFLLACTSSSIFDALKHAFADTVASAFPLLFDSLALFFVTLKSFYWMKRLQRLTLNLKRLSKRL